MVKKTVKIYLIILFFLVSIFLFLLFRFLTPSTHSCGEDFTDPRDGNVYSTVKIGEQCWFAQNLAYLPQVNIPDLSKAASIDEAEPQREPTFYVYGYEEGDLREAKSTKNYQVYGALYNQPASLIACPEGWRLPSDDDWKELEKHLGMDEEELEVEDFRLSGLLKEKLGSVEFGGKDTIGFHALGGGYLNSWSYFNELEEYAVFWSATMVNEDAYVRGLTAASSGLLRFLYRPVYSFSVRCIQDN